MQFCTKHGNSTVLLLYPASRLSHDRYDSALLNELAVNALRYHSTRDSLEGLGGRLDD